MYGCSHLILSVQLIVTYYVTPYQSLVTGTQIWLGIANRHVWNCIIPVKRAMHDWFMATSRPITTMAIGLCAPAKFWCPLSVSAQFTHKLTVTDSVYCKCTVCLLHTKNWDSNEDSGSYSVVEKHWSSRLTSDTCSLSVG